MSRDLRRVLAGRERLFRLAIGEIRELESLCAAGIGAIWHRLAAVQFHADDIRETIRLGLRGGGMSEVESTAIAVNYLDAQPLVSGAAPSGDAENYLQLAIDIIATALEGATAGKPPAEGSNAAPEMSPPSIQPGL